ncbi:MAG: outer membrane protein assembly factor BamD [Parachlamydiaceae bacterium]
MTAPSLNAAYVLQKGRIINEYEAATMSARDHYKAAAKAYESRHWAEAAKHFCILTVNFPNSVYVQEADYFLGVSYYFLDEYDLANRSLTEYLKVQNNPRYFQSAVEFKFAIAEQFNAGARRRPFGSKQLPKWVPGQSASLEIYNEVIATVPCHEIAARALIAKGRLLWQWRDYHDAIEAFQMVIRRFPKYEETPRCYLLIGKVYMEQSQYEFQNSDILALAQINLRRFEQDFPREELLLEAETDVMTVKEIYASGLYETGRFYERKCKSRAAVIYYNDAIRQFPETCAAGRCWKRINRLNPVYRVNLPEVETLNDTEIREMTEEFEDTSEGIDLENANIDFSGNE